MTQNAGSEQASAHRLQARALKTYQSNSYHSFSQTQAMSEAYRVIINTLLLARDACAARTLDVMVKHNAKTLKILDVLRGEIDGSRRELTDPEAITAADFLHRFYTELILRITDVLMAKSPVAEFDSIIESIKPIHKMWSDATKPAPAPSSNAVPTDAAS